MGTAIFQLDAFTSRRFAGNPAAVMPMDRFPSDAVLQAIAGENNLAETAFFIRQGEDYRLRWFTPTTEVPLCGHATLASAAVVMERLEPGRRRVVFHSVSGPLTVNRSNAGYVMDFPARLSKPVPTPPGLSAALGVVPVEVVADAFNYLLVLRLVPIFPFWLVNLVPALVGVRLPTYVLATFLGIVPGTFVYASLGNGLGSLVEEPDLAIIFRPSLLVPIVGLALLALVPVGYKHWRSKKLA